MYRQLICMAVSFLLLGTFAFTPQSVRAGDAQQRTQSTLASMHRWVGSGGVGQRWRAYLDSDRLETELAKGDDADANVLVGADADRIRSGIETWLSAPARPGFSIPELWDEGVSARIVKALEDHADGLRIEADTAFG